MNDEIDIEFLKKLCMDEENIIITQHALSRCSQRGITVDEIIEAVRNGEVIEQYPEDYPNPSCLVFGTASDKIIHIVCGTDNAKIWIITAYIPDKFNWEDDFKTRKKEN